MSTVSLPTGWINFSGGGSDSTLCGSGVPMAVGLDNGINANVQLSCTDDIYSINLTLTGGTPPFTWVATSGQLTLTGQRTATLKIHTGILGGTNEFNPYPLQCATAYSYGVTSLGIYYPDCADWPGDVCVFNNYNCFDQWIGWTDTVNMWNADFCHDKDHPVGDVHGGAGWPTNGWRIVDCPPCPGTEDLLTACSPNPLPGGCSTPLIGTAGFTSPTIVCAGRTMLQFTLNPYDCIGSGFTSQEGEEYIMTGATYTFTSSLTYVAAEMAADLYQHPENGQLWYDNTDAINAMYSGTIWGGCAPCSRLVNTDIVVTITDARDDSVAVTVHVS